LARFIFLGSSNAQNEQKERNKWFTSISDIFSVGV
jgi:hypothetical protein